MQGLTRSGKGSHFVGSPRGGESAPHLCPAQVPVSLVRTEEASLRAAEGSAAQCWGGGPPPGTQAGVLGRVTAEVGQPPLHGTGPSQPMWCGCPQLGAAPEPVQAAGGWGGGGEQGQALEGARPFPQPGTGLSASSGFRFLDKELVVGSSPG